MLFRVHVLSKHVYFSIRFMECINQDVELAFNFPFFGHCGFYGMCTGVSKTVFIEGSGFVQELGCSSWSDVFFPNPGFIMVDRIILKTAFHKDHILILYGNSSGRF